MGSQTLSIKMDLLCNQYQNKIVKNGVHNVIFKMPASGKSHSLPITQTVIKYI